jgi:hypothetical protein
MVLSIESTMARPKRGSLQHAITNAASGPDLPEVQQFRDKYQIRIG